MILAVKNLTKTIKDKLVLDSISFEVEKPSILGLCGKNGSGKTTLFRVLLELCKYEAGTIIDQSKKRKVIFDTPPNMDGQIIADYLNFFSTLYQGTMLNSEEKTSILKVANLDRYEKKRVSNLSFGMKKILYLSTLLIDEADLVIIDEPFNGLDSNTLEIAKTIILECKQKQNAAVIVSSHLIGELEDICDSLIQLKGRKAICTPTLEKSLIELRIVCPDIELVLTSIAGMYDYATKSKMNYVDISINPVITSFDIAQKLVEKKTPFHEIFYKKVLSSNI